MSLDKTLLGIAKSAVDTQQKSRDGRNAVSKGVDAVTNKSYANEDKKVAAAALRKWENSTWKPKVEAKLKQELKTRAPHLKPGSKAYQQTYDSLFNKNHKDLQSAKAKAQQQIGTLRQKGQTQRQVDNEYSQKEAARNNNTKLQAASSAARDTGEAVSGALATGSSRALRYPLQLAADIGENDDGGIFDRGAKALERHEDNLQQVYPAYADIQQNGNFGQKLALSAVEQIPNLALSFTGAGAAAKGAQLAGAGAKMTAATAYGTAAATMYPQAYGDGNDSTKQELENATPEQLRVAVRSKDIYKGHFDKNIKAGMSEDEAHQKSRDQTISSIAEESGDAVGLATLALSMIAPGVGSFTANQAAGGAVSKFGQKVFNKLAAKADAGKVAKYAIPTAVGTGIVGLNVAEEALQEGYTDYKAQQAAVDVGVKNKIDTAQTKEAMLMGGILGGAMGGGVYVGTRNSKLHQAQDDLKAAQQAYAEVAGQIPQLQQQIEAVSPRSPEGQALTARVEETRAALDAMAAEAEKASIPRTSLARRAPRIEPTNSTATEFDGGIDGATELDDQGFENALNPDGTPAPQATPAAPVLSEKELDAQDAQIAELIAEQAALDEAIEDGSSEKPLEESIAAAQSWYDSKRGEGKQGLSGVVSRAAATEQDTAFSQQQESIKGATAGINDYIASERAKHQQIDGQLQQEAQAATTDAEKQAVAQKIEQREADRAKEDELLSTREQLAQPYENESFDTTIVGADGAPFKLSRFWDSSLPATAKAKAIAEAFGGQVEQNVAKSDWANLPEGVQKELHQWFTDSLTRVRQSREGVVAQADEQVTAPIEAEQTQEVAPTESGLTMPVQQSVAEQAPIAPVEAEQVAVVDTPDAKQLTDENPVINIPAPVSKAANVATKPTVSSKVSQALIDKYGATKIYGREPWQLIGENDYGMPIYQHQNGERITQKASGDNLGAEAVTPDSYTVDAKELAKEHYTKEEVEAARERGQARADESKKSVSPTTDEGIYKSKPAAKAAMKKQKLDPKTTDIVQTDEGWGFVEKPADSTAPSNDVAIGKDGQAKWFGSNDKAQAFIDKKGLSGTHEVVSAGKSRFEVQPKQPAKADALQTDVAEMKTVSEGLQIGDEILQNNGVKHIVTGVKNNDSGGMDSFTSKAIDGGGNYKITNNEKTWTTSEYFRYFGKSAKPNKPLNDEQFAELTSSRTTPSTPTGEQSAPAKRAEAKKSASEKTQNEVSEQESKSRFADNKLFTEDKVAAARALLKSKMGQVNSGFDPEMAIAGMTLAGAYIESGVRKFGDYAKLMVEDFGDNIKPQLLSFWEGARNWDGLDTEGMTSVADSKREYDQLKAESEQASESIAPAKPKYPQTVGSGPQMKTFVGENQSGLPLYENKSGVRAIEEYGIFNNETVSITPTGIEQQPREDRYLTKEELAAKKDNNNDAGTSNQDDRQRADGELSTADQADAESRNTGRAEAELTSDVPNIDGRSNRSDTNDGDEAGQSAGKNKRATSTDSRSRTGSTQSNDGANAKSAKSVAVKATDYAIPPRDENAKQPSWFEIGERNVEIIELVQELESEGRHATPDEQALLADYKGWGSSKIEIFPHPTKGYSSPRWEALGEKLKSLLTDSEYATARRTTQYAHYTPPSIVNGIYAALEQFGFKGGQVFEPASGIGVFNGLMPRDMASKSHYVGVELDPMTALIAKHLYPLSDMTMGDYTKVKLPDNHFDVAVGNPPFADISYSYGAGKNKKPYLIHDYFFAKTLDKLKPGGVMAFVTSKGSMDKTNSGARESFAEQADLIGAIRLPNTAFKDEAGTAVVTDIIFLRKRMPDEASNGVKWTDTQEKTIDGEKISINEYFIDNPNMVLGRNTITSGQFGPTYTVESDSNNLAGQIETAIAQLPKDIFKPARGSNAEAAKVAEIDYGVKSSQQREGGVYVKDGNLMKVIDGVGKPLTHRYGTNRKRIALTDPQIQFLTDYTGVRDAFKQSQQDQLNDNPNWQDSLDSLNTAYDSFVKKHGRLMAHTISTTERADGKEITTTRFANKAILFLDVDGYVASALENIVDGEVVGKNAVIEKGSYFKGRTLNKPKTPTIKTTQDALVYVLNEVGTPNIKQIAKLVNKSEQEVIADLGSQVFTNPETGAVEMAEIYLSGNVVEKLATAEAMAAKDNIYQKNVDALKDVQPKFIAPNDISSNLGSGWIPGEVIKQFSQEVLDANITASYSGAAGIWDVSGYSRNSDYQTPSKTTKELMDAILNSKPITVSYTVDGKSYTDAEKTELAEQMASKIQKAFKDWIWKDTERANTLAEYYNKNYNNIVPPTFNGDHLTLAGMSSKIKLRPHQKTGIYRVVSQGDVYLNHAVGAGKTFTMIAAAMEEKRLGLINKPMFVVPNHMLAQFSQEFLMLYPAADIVVADEQNFHTHNRKQFVAEISVNNPDAIIITHTAFGKIGVKPETQKKFLENTLNDWREALLTAKSVKGEDNSQSVRQLERNIQTMETKLTDLLKAEAKDDTTFFEDMGVDKLIVDEMHEYRKLSYATRQGRIKGIVSSGSQMASDLQMKIELIREKNPTRAIVGASGTPVTNTMGELFSVQTYFQPKQLRKDGLHHFDNWSNQFGEVVKGLEQNAAGNYEVVPRFAKFLNVPELMSRVRWFMDVLTSDQLGDVVQRPDIVGGGRQIISVPAPDGFDEFQQGLADRITATRNRSGKPKKGDDNILKIINDGRFGAIDLRFNNPDLPSDPNSKLNRAIADMAQAYHDTANNEYHDGKGNVDELTGGAQMLFTNIGLGAQSAASTGFDMKAWINSELIRLGVEPDHIAFMADANSHAKKGKLFEDMRQGRKRILIGGSNMETGVNAQKRLTHLAHLDSPWYPATVEQREGRIIRQGNQNKEVVIRAYATKGSYDSTMWGMVARKARFIQQAMNGDISMRHMDDISEASAFEQASALSSGDPRALQLAGLAADVERLDRYYSAYENARIENSREAKRSRESAVRAERELSEVNKLLANHKSIETGGVIGKVGSKTFDNRQEFGEAIIKAFDKLKATQAQGEHILGTASGYNVVYNGVMLGETFIADADISIPKSNDNVLFDNNSGEVSASGIATSIINRVNGLADYKSAIQKKIEGFKKDADNFERRASQSFENEVERREKHAEYKELDDTLRAEAAAIKAQASGSNSARPLTDADRVPAKDEQPKFSKTNPAKGLTGTTSQQVITVLQNRFGKEVVASLVKSGKLRVRTLNDFVNADGRLLIPSDAEGFYYDGKVTLIADNLTPETVVATLLHELGGHAGIQSMLAPQTYMSLMENFYALVRSGNKYAVRAKSRAEAMTGSDSEARDEYIPYLITEYAQATERGGPLAVIKRFVNRVMAGVRAWVSANTGVQLKITPNDITQLAERMVKRLAEQSMDSMTIADVENMPAAQMQFSQESVQQANTPAFREWFDANNPDMRFSQVEAPQSQVDAVRKQYEGTNEWMKAPNGKKTKLTERQWLQVRTPAFKEWFGDWEGDPDNASKVVDENGEPKVVYHGSPTGGDFNTFTPSDDYNAVFFAENKDFAKKYTKINGIGQDKVKGNEKLFEVFLNAKNYFDYDNKAHVEKVIDTIFQTNETFEINDSERLILDGDKTMYDREVVGLGFLPGERNNNWDFIENEFVQEAIKVAGFDGFSVTEGQRNIAVYQPNQIKSATDNAGTFDSSNPDTRYSRRYSTLGTDGKPVTAKEKARDRVALAQATTMSSKFGVNLLLRRHLATPQHVALLNPIFKVFTDNVQARIAYENNEAGLIQTYLPEIWDTRLIVGKKKEAMERVSKAIFDGTMADKVWGDNELQAMFDLTDKDIHFYRRARQAIDGSVMNMTVDTLSSLAKGTKLVNIETIHRLKLQGMHPIFHNLALQQYMTDELEKLAKGGLITPKAEARMQKQLDAVFDVMGAIAGKYEKLVEDGYAPLMRFGHYAVEVRDKVSNDLDLFELYETKGQQRKAIKELKERYDETQFTVGTGTLNPEAFKQFKNKGLSPETVQLFAAELGLDDDGAYQAYLKVAVSDRSALKRLIHRKKVPGYSEDMPRVLSSFVMSNARYSGRGLYNSEIERSIQDIEDGNLQNEAQKVFENMENPQEEFAGTRSMMFHYFMGFSPAFLFLNLTQPFTQTIPKLTAYAGAARAHAYMAQALAMVGKHAGSAAINMGKKVAGLPTPSWTGFEDNLPAWVNRDDYLRMAREGHLDPQNIYMIKGLERGKQGVASGVWGNIEAAAGWPAEVSESMNRRSTMIAAFRVAKDMGDAKLKAKGFDSKYDFAVSIIQQTQGIYNKGNRSGLARGNGKLGQYGPLILVFKQFTINYTEQMIRHTRDKEVKSLAVAMMWQYILAGMLGLPFADDLRDLFEGIAYRVFGKAFNLPDYLEGLLGKSNADALMYGIASEKGRIDIHGRSSLGNVIPGTDVIRPGPTDWAEILGASSGFYESFFSAASMAADGKYKDALITASPRYIRDAASGAEIALTGSYRNTKGDKIMDLDKTDAVIKAMQFNPANNARPGRDRSNAYDMKNMLKAKTDYFSKHLAEAIYQENDERLDELYNEMDAWNERNAEHFNVDIDKIEKSAEKRVERKDFGSAERQNIQDSLALRQEELAGT